MGLGGGGANSSAPPLKVETALGTLTVADILGSQVAGTRVTLLVRPEAAEIRPAGAVGPNVAPGRLLDASFRGSYHLVRTEHAGGITLTCEVPVTGVGLPPVGQPLALWLDPAALTVMPAQP